MMTERDRQRLAALETDVDVRLADLWTSVMECEDAVFRATFEDDDARSAFAAFLRVAYSTGYNDALREVRAGRGGELHRRHGYDLP